MGWRDFFKKRAKSPAPDVTNLQLADLGLGFMVDYDMKTWQVTAVHTYDWGEANRTFEWQLKSHDDVIYLERDQGDEDHWTVSRKLAIGKIGANITDHIQFHGDPPDQIIVDGIVYYLDESGGGHFLENGVAPGKELLKWDFVDEAGNNFISIEQWSETDFEAAMGHTVAEFQFAHILPGPTNTER